MKLTDVIELVDAIMNNTTKSWLSSRGVATDKISPTTIIQVMQILCEVSTFYNQYVCPAVNGSSDEKPKT